MLTNKAVLGLERALCDGHFRSEDFEIEQKDAGANLTEVRVSYRYAAVYAIFATFNNAKPEVITETETTGVAKMLGAMGSTIRRSRQEDPITITMRPGEICDSEELGASTYDRFLEVLKTWLRHLRSELDSQPRWRIESDWREEVERLVADVGIGDASGEMLSAEEADAVRDRLDSIEADLSKKVQAVVQDQVELKRKLDELHSTVEFLKNQVERLDKPTLMKAVIARLVGWSRREENRKLLHGGSDAKALVADIAKDWGK